VRTKFQASAAPVSHYIPSSSRRRLHWLSTANPCASWNRRRELTQMHARGAPIEHRARNTPPICHPIEPCTAKQFRWPQGPLA
jgi:hypothetical protein